MSKFSHSVRIRLAMKNHEATSMFFFAEESTHVRNSWFVFFQRHWDRSGHELQKGSEGADCQAEPTLSHLVRECGPGTAAVGSTCRAGAGFWPLSKFLIRQRKPAVPPGFMYASVVQVAKSCTARPEPSLISRSEFVYPVDKVGVIDVLRTAAFFEKGRTNGAITHSIQGLHGLRAVTPRAAADTVCS